MAPHNSGEMGIGQAGQAIYIIYHRRWYMFSIDHLSIGYPTIWPIPRCMINSIATSCSIQDAPKIISEHCHATLHHRLNRSTRNCCNGRDSTGSCFVQAKFLQDVSCPTSFRAFNVAFDAESYVVLDAHVCVCVYAYMYRCIYCIILYWIVLLYIVQYCILLL